MSDRVTTVSLPGGSGFTEYGRHSVEYMIDGLRARASRDFEEAEAVLLAMDEDFRVETYVGIHAQRNPEVLQEGKST